MDNYGYTAENFLSQLPLVLADDRRIYALSTAIANALAARLSELREAEIYTRIDELPEGVLDILAYDFKVDWYDYDYTVEAKRNLIKTNYFVHRRLGTCGAVLTAVQAIYPRSGIEEWFDYGGQPYHFRLALESASPVIPFATDSLLMAVDRYKSLRSHLDGIVFRCSVAVGFSIRQGHVHYWGRIAGTSPQRARQGEIMPGNIEVSPSANGITYGTRLCGTTPGGFL